MNAMAGATRSGPRDRAQMMMIRVYGLCLLLLLTIMTSAPGQAGLRSSLKRKAQERAQEFLKPVSDTREVIRTAGDAVKEIKGTVNDAKRLGGEAASLLPAGAGEKGSPEPGTSGTTLLEVTESAGAGLDSEEHLGAWIQAHLPTLAPIDAAAAGAGAVQISITRLADEKTAQFQRRVGAAASALCDRMQNTLNRAPGFTIKDSQLGPGSYAADLGRMVWRIEGNGWLNSSGSNAASVDGIPCDAFLQDDSGLNIHLCVKPALAAKILEAQGHAVAGQGEMTAELQVMIELGSTRERLLARYQREAVAGTVRVELPLNLRVVAVKLCRNGVPLGTLAPAGEFRFTQR